MTTMLNNNDDDSTFQLKYLTFGIMVQSYRFSYTTTMARASEKPGVVGPLTQRDKPAVRQSPNGLYKMWERHRTESPHVMWK